MAEETKKAIRKSDPLSARKKEIEALLKNASEVFKFVSRRTRILGSLSWGPNVVHDFFKNKETVLPKPTYEIDIKALSEARESLATLKPKLVGEHPVTLWLTRTHDSFKNGIELLENVGTPRFYELSTALYGNSQNRLFDGQSTHLGLALQISHRMNVCALNDIAESMVQRDSSEFASDLEKRIESRVPQLPVRVELTDDVVAKVVAGMSRVRIRRDARFSDMELNALWNHEVESHCLTSHNGARQENCQFLVSGGPRTTRTQEGLAVFYEMYGHTMTQRRFIALCNRVEGIHLVESGADFLELYRWYKDRTENEMEAFYSAQRVFRGADLNGKYPFTKDVVYLAGLLEVYHFLQASTKNQNRLLVESLVCGRIALEDVSTIAWLRSHGILEPPYFVPDWLKNWEALLSFFSFSAVLNFVDPASFQKYFEENYNLQEWDLSL